MLLHSWAIALTVCSLSVIFLGLVAAVSGVKVLRFWDHGSDTARQIRLEGETWLTSALMEYGLFFQLLSLLLLVLAADTFSSLLVGAMCATGAFLANDYGIPVLLVKIVMVFLCGYWLLLHRFDLQSESYPLVRVKYIFLLFLVPLLLVDMGLQTLYLVSLEPDVITSCCGVIFRPGQGDGFNLLDPFSTPLLLSFFYGLAAFLVIFGGLIWWKIRGKEWGGGYLCLGYSAGWLFFFPVAIWAITIYFSSYVYNMPSHRCPFDLLQPEYGFVGYPIYLSLFGASWLGTTPCIVHALRHRDGLLVPVSRYLQAAVPASLLLLLLFLVITGYWPLHYILAGGETGPDFS